MSEKRHCPACGAEIPADAPAGQCPRCLMRAGFDFEPPPVDAISKLFPQLEILEFVGKGGMGAVYKARQPGLDRLVAVKVLPPEVGDDPAFAERFAREARAMARLSHPNIVAIHDFGRQELFYFVMEYVDGTNLRQTIEAGTLTPREALAIVPQICDALQFAHDAGIVHRDVKPENILMDTRGRVKIADFGLAKLLGVDAIGPAAETRAALTSANEVMGTPRYMAPEQTRGSSAVDHRADIYSLGVVFYEMLTGELPIGRFELPSKKVQVDVRLDDVVLRTLEAAPDRRYQHASEVKTEVESIAGDEGPGGGSLGGRTSAPRAARNMEKHVTALGVIYIASGIIEVVGGLLVFSVVTGAGFLSGDENALAITSMVGSLVAAFLVPSGIADIIAGIGLLRRREWGRIMALILGVLGLIQIPIGTAIGIYALWVLLQRETVSLFGRRARA